MKAIILAAGFGKRIMPLSDYIPKCLLPIVGRPLVDNIILYLKKFGVNEVAINTHHLAQKMIDYFQEGSKYGMKITLSHEPRILGTGGGIGNLRNFLAGEEFFIVHNGDTLTNLDLSPALELHKKKDAT
ncbi:nucleotidyltransferase family protein, partial [candidate division TA06 bacterium]|nr:nucleotidyltransferase family protein [candidate division TA06 bacterium]